MRSCGKRWGILLAGALLASAGRFAQPALASGSLDPGYQDLLAEPARAVGRSIDWLIRLDAVDKRFYTYTFRGRYVPLPGEPPCDACPLAITFRGRPDEVLKPPRFKAGQVVKVRGVVIRLRPLRVIAGFVAPR